MAKYNIHAGHNYHVPGANGFLSETKEARNVKNKVIAMLRAEGHTVYDCTDEDGKTQSQNLANIVKKCNSHAVDLDVSIHFNAFNKQAHGTETLQYSSKTNAVSARVCKKISALGYTNRGVKDGSHLYVVRKTNSKAILIECCFCDNQGDAARYNVDKMAKAIAEAILNETISSSSSEATSKPATDKLYRVRKTWEDAKSQLGAYANLDNAKKECKEGYTVFDWNGKAVYSNVPKEEVKVDNLYRVRKTWDDVKSQLGAYANLDNAKKNCPSGYTVFDWNGKSVYSNNQSTSSDPNSQLYRVRKTWEDAKSQLGAYKEIENAKKNCPSGYTVFDWNGKSVYTGPISSTTPEVNVEEVKPVAPDTEDISPLKGLDHEAFIEYVGTLAKADMKKTGILASITIAQSILESAWGQSELSLKANNLFGMKASLSGNSWGSEWDGKIYAKYSPEEMKDGSVQQFLSDFRAYDDPAKSIKDHSDYLCRAKKGSELRYKGLKGETDYKKAIQIIKDGGYATDSGYVNKIIDIIEKYDLDIWDMAGSPSELDDIRDRIDEINKIVAKVIQFLESFFNLTKGFFNK